MLFVKSLRAWLRAPRQRKPTINLRLLGCEYLEDRTCPSWFSRAFHAVTHFIDTAIVKPVIQEVKAAIPIIEQVALDAAITIVAPELDPVFVAASATAITDVAKGDNFSTIAKDVVTAGVSAEIAPAVGALVGDVVKPGQLALSSGVGGVLGQAINAVPVTQAVAGAVTHAVVTGETNPLQIAKDAVTGVGLVAVGDAASAVITQAQNQVLGVAQELGSVVNTAATDPTPTESVPITAAPAAQTPVTDAGASVPAPDLLPPVIGETPANNTPAFALQPETAPPASASQGVSGVGTGIDWSLGVAPFSTTTSDVGADNKAGDFFTLPGVDVDTGSTGGVSAPIEVPQPSSFMQTAKESLRQINGFDSGVADEVRKMVTGVETLAQGGWNLTAGWVTNPDAAEQTLTNAKHTIDTIRDHPYAVAQAIIQPYVNDWQQGNYGHAAGGVVVNVVPLFFGVGEGEAVAEVSEAAGTTTKVGEVASTIRDEAVFTPPSPRVPLTSFEDVIAHLQTTNTLPENFITKDEARTLGWDSAAGNLDVVAPGTSIGGDIFRNLGEPLPAAPDRVWREVDINYMGGWRGSDRLLYSNDGLLYKTTDHYTTFDPIE